MEQEPVNKGTYTETQKQRLLKWRLNHHEQFNAICRKASAVYYEKHKEDRKKASLERYYKNKALKLIKIEVQKMEDP